VPAILTEKNKQNGKLKQNLTTPTTVQHHNLSQNARMKNDHQENKNKKAPPSAHHMI